MGDLGLRRRTKLWRSETMSLKDLGLKQKLKDV